MNAPQHQERIRRWKALVEIIDLLAPVLFMVGAISALGFKMATGIWCVMLAYHWIYVKKD